MCRFNSHLCRKNAICRNGSPSSLQITQNSYARLQTCRFFQLLCNPIPNRIFHFFTRFFKGFFIHHGFFFVHCAFSYNDNRKNFTLFLSFFQMLCNVFYIIRNFWNQYNIATSSNSCIESKPPSLMPHHFDYHNSIMTMRGCMQAVYRLCCNRNSGMKTKARICQNQVIIDCFWETNYI